MAKYKHIEVKQSGVSNSYVTTAGGGSTRVYRYPARNTISHAAKLREDIEDARTEAIHRTDGLEVNDIVLEFAGAIGAGMESDSLDDRRSGVELLSTREENNVTYATVYVPENMIASILKKIEAYESKTTKKGDPKHKALMESLDSVRLPVVRSFWTDDPAKFPADVNETIWWEVWLRRSALDNVDNDRIPRAFRAAAGQARLRVIPGVSVFPERIAFLMHGSAAQWASSFSLLLPLAELRRAIEMPADYVQLPPREQRAWINAAVDRIQPPPANAPAVCIVDTGVAHIHPLIRPALDSADCHAWNSAWRVDDVVGHGTEMAGIAIYGGDLATLLSNSSPFVLTHRLESVKFLDNNVLHDPENFGNVTVESVALAESHNPDRQRVVCMMATAGNSDRGAPLLWSSALDQHAGGQLDDVRRLYVVSVGNVRNYLTDIYTYPDCNRTIYAVEDPAQAYNALSVGGYTEKVVLSADHTGRTCLARSGGLSPLSRTSMMWDDEEKSEWPYKPDVVMEAGNYLTDSNGRPEAVHDLHLLTTRLSATGDLLTTTGDTSAATAQAAKMAAEIMADYPTLWPETVRGLIVHSAEWTNQMVEEFPGSGREAIRKRLRTYGYGVPSTDRARYTLNNQVSLVVQDSLQPFKKDGPVIRSNECKFHALPWPESVLEQLGSADVTVKLTLSYFIEPSPGRRGFTNKFRYASHGLRFAVRGPTETNEAFVKRISKDSWTEEEKKKKDKRTVDRPPTGNPQSWEIGTDVRTRGSIHCDWWTASAAEIARCGAVAVFPVTGWWRERPQLEKFNARARYSLIVTLSTADESVDLYTPIAQQVGVITAIEI